MAKIVFVWGSDSHGYLVASDGRETRVEHVGGGMKAGDAEWAALDERPRATPLGKRRYSVAGFVVTVRDGFAPPYGTSELWSRRAA
jgi:hypothetical protein